MKIKEAEAITHTLSKPGKMPGFAYSTPAHECKTGTILRNVDKSVCKNCYAYLRGRYRFQNVIDAQYKRSSRNNTHPEQARKNAWICLQHTSSRVQDWDHIKKR